MKTDPPGLEASVLGAIRNLVEHEGEPGDYALTARTTVDRNGEFFTSYDWFWRPADDDPRWESDPRWKREHGEEPKP